MSAIPSVEFYFRALNERFSEFRRFLSELENALPCNDAEPKKRLAAATAEALRSVQSHLSTSDRPAWIDELLNRLLYFVGNSHQTGAASSLFHTLLETHAAITAQKWDFGRPSAAALDFAAIFRKHLDASKVRALFDELVGQLEQLAQSGAIDSVSAIQRLQRLIETIKCNARGGVMEVSILQRLLKEFFKNAVWEQVKAIPVAGPFVAAVAATWKNLDAEITDVRDKISEELAREVNSPTWFALASANQPLLPLLFLNSSEPDEEVRD